MCFSIAEDILWKLQAIMVFYIIFFIIRNTRIIISYLISTYLSLNLWFLCSSCINRWFLSCILLIIYGVICSFRHLLRCCRVHDFCNIRNCHLWLWRLLMNFAWATLLFLRSFCWNNLFVKRNFLSKLIKSGHTCWPWHRRLRRRGGAHLSVEVIVDCPPTFVVKIIWHTFINLLLYRHLPPTWRLLWWLLHVFG